MSTHRVPPAALALALVLAFTACATSPAASPETDAGAAAPSTNQATSDGTMTVSVVNNRADGGAATIYIEPAAGVRTALGTVDPGATKSFTYRIEDQNRTVRLMALNALGQSLESERITVPRGAGLSWDLQINSVRVRRSSGGR